MKKSWLKKVEGKLAHWSENLPPIKYDPIGPLFFRGELWIIVIVCLAWAVYSAFYGDTKNRAESVLISLLTAYLIFCLETLNIKGPIGDRVRVWSSGMLMLFFGSVFFAALIFGLWENR